MCFTAATNLYSELEISVTSVGTIVSTTDTSSIRQEGTSNLISGNTTMSVSHNTRGLQTTINSMLFYNSNFSGRLVWVM